MNTLEERVEHVRHQPTWFLLKAPVPELPAALGIIELLEREVHPGCGVETIVDCA